MLPHGTTPPGNRVVAGRALDGEPIDVVVPDAADLVEVGQEVRQVVDVKGDQRHASRRPPASRRGGSGTDAP